MDEEPVREPDLAICDAHHHLWQRPDSKYWLDDFLADATSGHRITSSVFVECRAQYREDGARALRPVGETEAMEQVARASLDRQTKVCAAIVGHADVTLGDGVAAVLDAHRAASPRFRGIRHTAAWDAHADVPNSQTRPPEGLLADPVTHRAVRRLGEGEVFEAWCYHGQIPDVAALARACPDVTIVLDHYGGPLGVGPYAGRADEVFADWRRNAAELARCENVVIKLGGILMPRNGYGWDHREEKPGSAEIARATARYPLAAIELFGIERCLFESNFPVDSVSCSYRVLWNAFKRIVADLSAEEKRRLFHDNALRVYQPILA